jgi:hypothetical protein
MIEEETRKLSQIIAHHLSAIQACVSPDTKLTLVARHTGELDDGMIVSGDDFAEVAAFIQRQIAKKRVHNGSGLRAVPKVDV